MRMTVDKSVLPLLSITKPFNHAGSDDLLMIEWE